LFPIIAGLLTYYIANRFFPEEKSNKNNSNQNDLRGGDTERFLNRFKDFINDRSVKSGIISVFIAAGLQH